MIFSHFVSAACTCLGAPNLTEEGGETDFVGRRIFGSTFVVNNRALSSPFHARGCDEDWRQARDTPRIRGSLFWPRPVEVIAAPFSFFLFLIVTGFTENIVHFEQLQYQREFHESPHSHGSFNDIKY